MAAVERGLTVKIFRTSHALPSARTGIFKPSDTYGSVIEAAYEAGVVPDWKDSAFYGVPVDILSKLMVENSLLGDDYSGVIHLENKDPLHFTAILQQLLKLKSGQDNQVLVSLESWKNSCLQAALRLTGESSQLASVLFATRGQRSAVENMFTPYSVDTTYYGHRNEESKLSNLTSEAYWQKLYQNLDTKNGEATTNVIYK
jgi:thioester reductase-like protein